MPQKDREAYNEYQRAYRAAHRDRVNETERKSKGERYRQRKLDAIILKGGKCKHCGLEFNGQNACVFDFHHPIPEEKGGNLNELSFSDWSAVVQELEKCVLLCANCHRMEHWRRE